MMSSIMASTVDVEEDHYLIHALTDDAEEGVLDGSMEKRIAVMIPGYRSENPSQGAEDSP